MGLISSTQFRQRPATSTASSKARKPADLPVQAPTKYETVINLQDCEGARPRRPPSALARADEVIE